jgi:UbiD family decarboxylase
VKELLWRSKDEPAEAEPGKPNGLEPEGPEPKEPEPDSPVSEAPARRRRKQKGSAPAKPEPKAAAPSASEPNEIAAGALAEYHPLAPSEPRGSLDLRAFIELLEEAGRLVRVRERVDWRLGVGRWTRARRKPLLFENIKGYPGQRVFTNGLVDANCIALALGFEPGTPPQRVVKEAKKRLRDPITPRIMSSGPVLANVIPASVLDLLEFPVPQWSQYDAGRYIGTWHLNISRDPDTGQRNVGVYRMQALGQKQATISASKGSDFARHVARAEARGTELNVAVAIGAPEATVIAAGAACPAGIDEFELAGALEQKPVELVQCGHLEVPAYSEIVIEGFIHPNVRVEDGPYFDYYGRPNTNPKAYLFEATRVLHRDDPIFRGTAIGKPGAEDHQLFAFLAQLGLVDFHGSRLKQLVQNFLWKRRSFDALQTIGSIASDMRRRG